MGALDGKKKKGREQQFESLDDEPGSLTPTTSELPPPPTRASLLPAVRKSVTSMLPAARASLRSVLPEWKPRWKPWSPQRAASVTLAFGAVFGLVVYLAYPRFVQYAARLSIKRLIPKVAVAEAPPTVVAAAAEPAAPGDAADAHLNRVGRSPLSGGLLIIPPSFHSQDGAYDLVLHMNGNTDLVEESYASAKVDALVVIFNLGVGSGVYEDRFSNVGIIPEILDRVKTTMEKRGLVAPHLRRMAMGAWSAGYGGVEKALAQPEVFAKVDAIYMLDAMHCGYTVDGQSLEMPKIQPFVDFAREAVAGKKLFFATHSDIAPPTYAGTGQTLDAIMGEVGVRRHAFADAPAMPVLQALIGVLPKDKVKPLTPKTEAKQGGLIIRGYTGEGPEDHMSHLMQMSETALPLLVDRWSKK